MRSSRILKKAGINSTLRFSSDDKAFFNALSKTELLSNEMATKHYYLNRKNGAEKPLSRFVNAGILEKFSIYTPDGKRLISYRFKSQKIAKSFGGKYSITSINRSDYHELLTAEGYFQLNQPEDFRKEKDFSKEDNCLFPTKDRGRFRPDAIATSNGETIYIEADAGHYSKQQIQDKLGIWGDKKQLWIQPISAKTKVPSLSNIKTVRV